MFKNYFKIGWRNLVKSKGYSAINIGGLAVGMAVAILIGLWMYDELSFNKYHNNYESIAQVMCRSSFNGESRTTPAFIASPRSMLGTTRRMAYRYGLLPGTFRLLDKRLPACKPREQILDVGAAILFNPLELSLAIQPFVRHLPQDVLEQIPGH